MAARPLNLEEARKFYSEDEIRTYLSRNPGRIPAGYSLMLLQGLSLGLTSLLQLFGVTVEEGKEK